VVVVVEAEEEVEDYLGSNHRKELRIQTEGNNSMILAEEVAVVEDIQDSH
jgi:hypothetical protein